MKHFMEKLLIIKIGGNILDQEQALLTFLKDFASISGKKILVHGGGKLVNSMALKLGVPQQMIEGRRITDAETLKIVTMLYAGVINKNITAQLQANGCDAIGLCGADGNLILAHKRIHHSINYGFAGDIDRISAKTFHQFLDFGLTPVMSPLTHDGKGQLLNTNADTIAQEIAKSLSGTFEVSLIYLFEKNGVLLDPQDESTVISQIDPF